MPDSVPPLEKSIPASLKVSEASPLGSQCGFGRDDRRDYNCMESNLQS